MFKALYEVSSDVNTGSTLPSLLKAIGDIFARKDSCEYTGKEIKIKAAVTSKLFLRRSFHIIIKTDLLIIHTYANYFHRIFKEIFCFEGIARKKGKE
ncbi:MAG TPA: hypothetical protein VMT35_18110 [Ignavibacteriaceae bacterium]|nr:hypothetical protein [Ignavibacteriaceae bacterium]